MKTLHEARLRAQKHDIEDMYLFVTAMLMSKIIASRDEPFPNSRRDTYQSFRIPDLSKFHQN